VRRVIQLAAAGHENTSRTQSDMSLFALCDDGKIFIFDFSATEWIPLPAVPQPTNGSKCESDRICHALGGVCCEADEE